MNTANTVVMHGSLDAIVKLAVETERWPEILPHYRWLPAGAESPSSGAPGKMSSAMVPHRSSASTTSAA
jgi:hypothetical protein